MKRSRLFLSAVTSGCILLTSGCAIDNSGINATAQVAPAAPVAAAATPAKPAISPAVLKAISDHLILLTAEGADLEKTQALCSGLKGEQFENEPKCKALETYFLNKFKG